MALAVLLMLGGCGGGGGGGGGTPSGHASSVFAGVPILPNEDCPYGGVRIDYGIDENGNGVLDPGEVDGYSIVCNGAGAHPNPITPPAGPPAQYTVDLNGGASASVGGADSGYVYLNLASSGATGHIKLFNTGVADASFSFPATLTTTYGAVPLVVAAGDSLTVPAYSVHSGLPVGTIHTHIDDPSGILYLVNGTGDGDESGTVTGIQVGAGATLNFEVSYYNDSVYVTVPNDIRNEGTITVEWTPETYNSGNLIMKCNVFYGAAGSLIRLAGGSNGTLGYDGGDLSITAFSNLWGIWPYYTGAIYNQGGIDTTGADGTPGAGGDAGYVELLGNLGVINTGAIDASGGDSSGSFGGEGGNITLDGYNGGSYYGNVYNAGTLDNHGGQGYTTGGRSGDVFLTSRGDLRNSGDILSWGGDGETVNGANAGANNCESPCPKTLQAMGGNVLNAGDILAHGGTSLNDGGYGGSGVDIYFQAYSDSLVVPNVPPGSIHISGNIDASGGDGSSGGYGAQLYAEINAIDLPAGQEIQLLGYQGINMNGSSGTPNGGYGGGLYAYNAVSEIAGVLGPAGGIVNYVPISAVGGMGTSQGGGGGGVELYVEPATGYLAPWQVAVNYAAIDLSGGAGDPLNLDSFGGSAGALRFEAPTGVENHGELNVSGGMGYVSGGSPGYPNDYNGVILRSGLGPVINSGVIHAEGGGILDTGGGNGGQGNDVEMVAPLVVHTGLIHANGGSASEPAENIGGDGGSIYMLSTNGFSMVTGDIDASGGTAGSDGAVGMILIDGINRTEEYPLAAP